MNIAWLYLDKRSAAISALKDYESMKYIAAHAQQHIAEREGHMTSIGSPVLTTMPKGPSKPGAGENRIVKALDEINVIHEQRQRAQAYMAWFEPAWSFLSEDERFVLTHFFMCDEYKQVDNVLDICERYHIERSSAYKKKDRALARLTLLLYGK